MGSSFAGVRAYGGALLETPRRFVQQAATTSTAKNELRDPSGSITASMQRTLRWYDVMGIAVGGMIGAGVFITTGKVAHHYTGPAIIVSYLFAGVAALFSALCYGHFASQVPAAGGAFSYVHITFGEFAAFLTGANLIMEYVISNAVVARSFTSYFSTAFGVTDPDLWRISLRGVAAGYNLLDVPAVALVVVATLCLCFSTKSSSILNVVVTLFHLALIFFVIAVGFSKGSMHNLTAAPEAFAPFGARGVVDGAALVYFSFIGYDVVCTVAEEVQESPSSTIPRGITGSVLIVTIIYCLMAAALVLLVPYNQIDDKAPFSSALREVEGWKWASNIVGLTASIGIVSSLLVAMLGQARYLCVMGRSHLIPTWFAHVHDYTGTPLNASLFLGGCTAIIALFTGGMDILLDLICIGILFVCYIIANAVIFQRHALVNGNTTKPRTILFLCVISGLSIAFVVFWHNFDGGELLSIFILSCGVAIVTIVVAFNGVASTTVDFKRKECRSYESLITVVAAWSIFCNIFLMGSIKKEAFVRFGIWLVALSIIYLFYSLHESYDARMCASKSSGQALNHPNPAFPSTSMVALELGVVPNQ